VIRWKLRAADTWRKNHLTKIVGFATVTAGSLHNQIYSLQAIITNRHVYGYTAIGLGLTVAWLGFRNSERLRMQSGDE
jgi:hypothetical protein